ncbi:MAG: hypothetical protein VXX85_02250 [Candidatus Margulisiibacteriota bacterium]|nr:hypothetical protein [Candidatus Margulisiibacteriota bacterium]
MSVIDSINSAASQSFRPVNDNSLKSIGNKANVEGVDKMDVRS